MPAGKAPSLNLELNRPCCRPFLPMHHPSASCVSFAEETQAFPKGITQRSAALIMPMPSSICSYQAGLPRTPPQPHNLSLSTCSFCFNTSESKNLIYLERPTKSRKVSSHSPSEEHRAFQPSWASQSFASLQFSSTQCFSDRAGQLNRKREAVKRCPLQSSMPGS